MNSEYCANFTGFIGQRFRILSLTHTNVNVPQPNIFMRISNSKKKYIWLAENYRSKTLMKRDIQNK